MPQPLPVASLILTSPLFLKRSVISRIQFSSPFWTGRLRLSDKQFFQTDRGVFCFLSFLLLCVEFSCEYNNVAQGQILVFGQLLFVTTEATHARNTTEGQALPKIQTAAAQSTFTMENEQQSISTLLTPWRPFHCNHQQLNLWVSLSSIFTYLFAKCTSSGCICP